MKVLQFAFSSGPENEYLPAYHTQNSVVYTGTHDNNTVTGWLREDVCEKQRMFLEDYIGREGPDGIAWDLIRLAMSSVARQAVIPLQDVLGLGSEARMNTPGTDERNWVWRFRDEALKEEYGQRLRRLAVIFGRCPVER